MTTTDNIIFKILKVIAWMIFVGLSIEAGALIVNFFFSLYQPETVPHLYQKLDLTALYKKDEFSFYNIYSFILILAVLKAVLFYAVVILVTKIDLYKPFTQFVYKQIALISYFTFSIGIISYIGRQATKKIAGIDLYSSDLGRFWEDSQAFILMAAVIYIIAVIFKRGIDLQNENDLTV